MKQPEMVIFTRTFDLLSWLLPATNHFPRAHRHDFTRRLLDAAFDLRERLEEANLRKGPARRERLERADEALVRMKVYLRLAAQLGWMTPTQHQHVAGMYAEIGRLLGGWPNLFLAWHQAAAGKRGHANVAAFEYRLEENLLQLQAELVARSYRPGAYQSFYIHEPKRRLISAAPFRDRVVHHALCNVIEPVFERSFIADSFANRVGKGTHRALDRLQSFTRRFPFALQCDLRQFFPSLDHEILFDTLARKVTDDDVLRLIRLILDSGRGVLREEYDMAWFPGDDLLAATRPRGLPIGNLTSQFWANCFLNSFDHFVKRELRCPGYVRYVDDFVLFGEDKRTLWTWKDALVERLARLRLTVHPGAQPRPVRQGVPFLGFLVYPHRRRLKRRKGIYFQRKLRRLVAGVEAGEVKLEQLNASLRGWVEHASHGNTVGLRKAILGKIRLKPPRPHRC